MVCYRTYRAGLHAGSDPQLPTYSKAPLCEVRGPLRTAMSIERGLELVQSPTVVQTVFSLARPCRCLHLFGRSISMLSFFRNLSITRDVPHGPP